MSRKAIRWINGIGYRAPSEKQRSFLGGRLSIPTNEENIDKICDQLKQMAAMCRDIDEEWLGIDILKQDGEQKMMRQFSFERSTYHPEGKDYLLDKIKEWERGGQEAAPAPAPEPDQSDPFADDEDLPF